MLYLLYLTYLRCCLLLMIKQNCLQKLLRTRILLTPFRSNLRLLTDFDRLVFFTDLSHMEFLVRCLALNCLFSVIAASSDSGWEFFARIKDVPQGSILGPALFQLYIKVLTDDVMCDIAINADDATLYFQCDQATDLCQQLESASELESDLRDTVDWDRK